MKVYVLSILLNAGTSDQEYDMVAVCKSVDKCKEEVINEMKRQYKNINVDKLKEEIIKTNSKDICKFIITEDNKYDTTFKIWETELI